MFNCIRELVDEIKPLAIVQGHVHELFVFAEIGMPLVYNGPGFQSLVVSPGPKGGILTVEAESVSFKL